MTFSIHTLILLIDFLVKTKTESDLFLSSDQEFYCTGNGKNKPGFKMTNSKPTLTTSGILRLIEGRLMNSFEEILNLNPETMETNAIQNSSSNSVKSINEVNVQTVEKVLYTGFVRTTGGREGAARSSDGHLDINLTSPGTSGTGTNPEQLFAAGWSACFIGAMKIAAGTKKLRLPGDLAVDTEVDLATTGGGYFLQARLNVSLPGIEEESAWELIEAAHQTCPYSKATRGNINVTINLLK